MVKALSDSNSDRWLSYADSCSLSLSVSSLCHLASLSAFNFILLFWKLETSYTAACIMFLTLKLLISESRCKTRTLSLRVCICSFTLSVYIHVFLKAFWMTDGMFIQPSILSNSDNGITAGVNGLPISVLSFKPLFFAFPLSCTFYCTSGKVGFLFTIVFLEDDIWDNRL